jgi:hypothetical protein
LKKSIIIIFALSLFPAIGLCFAQATPQGKQVKFSSAYTDLKTRCKSALTKKEEKEAEKLGQDIPMVCGGYGGYEIFLASHGAMTQLAVRIKTGEEIKNVVQETLYIGDPVYTRKVEWRLANGVPFALIFRRDVNDEPEDPSVRKKIGEVLRVVGLKDEKINFEVDVKKSPNPNEEARRLADNAYAAAKEQAGAKE